MTDRKPSAKAMEDDSDDSALGKVCWYCSDEGSGPDVGISLGLGGGKMLWAGEITKDAYAEDEAAAALGDDNGWWLILYAPERCILGKFTTAFEAREFIEILSAEIKPPRATVELDPASERGLVHDEPLADSVTGGQALLAAERRGEERERNRIRSAILHDWSEAINEAIDPAVFVVERILTPDPEAGQ